MSESKQNLVLKFGLHKGKKFYETPLEYQQWLVKQSWFKEGEDIKKEMDEQERIKEQYRLKQEEERQQKIALNKLRNEEKVKEVLERKDELIGKEIHAYGWQYDNSGQMDGIVDKVVISRNTTNKYGFTELELTVSIPKKDAINDSFRMPSMDSFTFNLEQAYLLITKGKFEATSKLLNTGKEAYVKDIEPIKEPETKEVAERKNTIIGFANQFYTLWNFSVEPMYSTIHTAAGERHVKTGDIYKYFYIKNISKDLEKVKSLYPNVTIDDSLRGKSRDFEIEKGSKWVDYEPEVLSKGRNRGMAIQSINEKDLIWSYENEPTYEDENGYNKKRIEYIENKLNEYGLFLYNDRWLTKEEIAAKELEKSNKDQKHQLYLNGGKGYIKPEKNLDGNGFITIDEVQYYFPEHKRMYYNDFVYALPTIKGVGKKIKGKTIEIQGKLVTVGSKLDYDNYDNYDYFITDKVIDGYVAYEPETDTRYYKVVLVESFRILPDNEIPIIEEPKEENIQVPELEKDEKKSLEDRIKALKITLKYSNDKESVEKRIKGLEIVLKRIK